MLKFLRDFLKVFFFVQLGGFVGEALKTYINYRDNIELYRTYSAPWYAPILVAGGLTAVTLVLTSAAFWIVDHKLKKKASQEQ